MPLDRMRVGMSSDSASQTHTPGPTAKNDMVREMYRNLNFELVEIEDSGASRWVLGLDGYVPSVVPMLVEVAQEGKVLVRGVGKASRTTLPLRTRR